MPKLIPTLVAGFNSVASHIQLIILPLAVDLLLWLGPKIQVKTLLHPLVDYLSKNMQTVTLGADSQEQIKQSILMINQFVDQFNLGVLVRTFPVGIPSLMSRELTITSPISNGSIIEIQSLGYAFLIVIFLTLIGFLLGTIYFNSLSRYTVTPVLPPNNKKLFTQYGQSLVTALIIIAVITIVMIPATTIMTLASMISPSIGQFLILVMIFILVWLAIPLVFAPHGIFVLNQKAYPSMMLSIRMVRFFLPGTGMFIMTSALMSEGLNMLWSLPDSTSWLTLIGIFGHSFVVTALLAASFIYYRGGLKWMQESIQNISDQINKPDVGGPLGTDKK